MNNVVKQLINLAESGDIKSALELIENDTVSLCSLFENSGEFIQLANATYEESILCDNPPYEIGAEIARHLILKQSDVIVSLFKSAKEFIRLARETNINIPCELIWKQTKTILSLFQDMEDIQELATVNKQIAMCLEIAEQTFEENLQNSRSFRP